MLRRVPGFLALAAALVVVSCHDDSDDDHHPPPTPLVVTSLTPIPLVSFVPTPFTIAGSGFTRASVPTDIVQVTFRTTDGTPFADGTSAFVQLDGTVISDTQIQGTTPLTNSPGIWISTVEVTDSKGTAASAAPIADFVGLTVFDTNTPTIPANQATPVLVLGLAFLPLGGNATIRFTSTIPGAFPGGLDTLDVPGTVNLLRISGITPVMALAAPVPAYVSVILDDIAGAPEAASTCALVVFEPPPPVPVVVNTITSPLPLVVPSPFTVNGSGFLGATNTSVSVTFTATSGTPFVGGTAASVSVLGNATSDSTVDGTSPIGTSTADVQAFVTVERVDSVAGTSATAIALLTVPVETVDTFTPSLLCTDTAAAFSISGTNLPTPQTATVRFRALNGTPFAAGLSDTEDVVANIVSAQQIDGLSPLATSAPPFLAEVTVILQSGLELPMGIECLFGVFPQCQPPPGSLVVTNLADSGPGSLRDAILSAPPDGIITFQDGLTGMLNVDSTLLIAQPVEILGPGADVIRVSGQQNDYPVFTIGPGASGTSIERLTIADSAYSGDGGGCVVLSSLTLTLCEVRDNGSGGRGAGVFVTTGGSLTLKQCRLRDNSSQEEGGAVFVDSQGAAQAIACTFDGNNSDEGGAAVSLETHCTFSALNCTFQGNSSTGGPGGGAILIASNSTVNLTHCTLAENSTHNRGGGVLNQGTLNATNCIFARNSDGKGDVEISNKGNSTNNTTFSLVRVGTGSNLTNGSNGNLVGTPSNPINAQLGLLIANGGATPTMALGHDSPALDAADPGSSEPVDQRGVDRPQGTAADMGAYEETIIF